MWWMVACSPSSGDSWRSPVVIDEVMARNDSTVMIDGTFSDWVEILNVSDEDLGTGRLGLEADGGTWSAEPGEVLLPGERVVWWADGSPAAKHLPFTLAGSGDHLTLTLDGAPVDRVATGDLPADVALARIPSGGPMRPTTWPTPGDPSRIAPSPTLDPSDALFQRTRALELELGLDASSQAELRADPRTEIVASLAYEGAWFPEVSARIKGQYGSARTLDQKCAWRIDVDDFSGSLLRGQEHLTLNNAVQDPTYTHEWLTYEVYRAAGVPAPRIGYALVRVNDEAYGLYVVVETIDRAFLERRYADPSGPLFEGAYGVDFEPGGEAAFELDQGEESDRAWLTLVIDALQATPDDAGIARLERLIDLDEWLTAIAVAIATDDWDGYYSSNNYRIYRDPIDGRFDLLPWGVDQTWLGGTDAWGGQGAVIRFCGANASCRARYAAKLLDVADLVESLALEQELDELDAWLAPLAAEDPRREYDDASRALLLDATRQGIASAPDRVRSQAQP